MKHLKAGEVTLLRDQLQRREAELTAEIEGLLADQRAASTDGRTVDAAALELDHMLGFAEALRDQYELDDVHSALGRMDLGTYGRCLCCGARIPMDRLCVQPAAPLCVVCQGRAEEGEAPDFLAPRA